MPVNLFTQTSDMKKFLIKILTFFALLIFFDYAMGKAFDYLSAHAKGGMTQRDNYICNELETDILLCGSSRCVHHYNPKIISDSLRLSCYNSGQDGNGVILLYGRLQMIKSHHEPELIIYDITPNFDLLLGEDDHRYLTWLKPHYDRKGISEIFQSVDKTERFKMLSSMYRYNSHFIELAADFFHPIINVDDNGFVPIATEMDKSKIKKGNGITENNFQFDSLKIDYLRKYADEVGNKLIFVVSPIWYGMETAQLQPLIDLCKSYHISFFDYSNNPKYVHNDLYFKDGLHLNARGADEFTQDLIKELKRHEILNKKK